jgi:MFS family permease
MDDVRQQLGVEVPNAGHGSQNGVADPNGDTELELVCFEGRPAQRIDFMLSAPFGWWAAGVLALVALVDRVEQTILAGALPDIARDFDLNNTQSGSISFATAIAGAALLFVVARLASQVNRVRFLIFTLIVWSILSVGSGLATSFAVLLIMRTLLGAASAFNNPLAGSLIGDYYPRAGRSRAYGADRLAYYLGGPIGIALGGIVAGAYGWRAAFFVMAVPGIVVALLLLTLREPVRGISDRLDVVRASTDPEVAAKLKADSEKLDEEAVLEKFRLFDPEVWADFRYLLSIPTLRSVFICLAVLFFGLGGLFNLTPKMFVDDYGLSDERAATIAAAVGGTAILVGFAIGFGLGDRFQGRVRGWRIVLGGIGLAIGAFGTMLYGLGLALPVTIAAWAILNIGIAMSIPTLTAATADLCGAERRGQAFALYFFVTVGASAAGPLVVGILADTIAGTLQTGFLFTAPLLAIASFLAFRARGTYDADADASLQDVVAYGPSQ